MPIRSAPLRPVLILCFLWSVSGVAQALQLKAIELTGVDEEMAANARAHLALEQLDPARRATLSEGRLAFYLRTAPKEIREGLEPYGYYDAEVTPVLLREGEAVTVRFDIALGAPVRVRHLAVGIDGAAESDPEVKALLENFRPQQNEVFHHGIYETSKAGVSRLLGDRGYFDAELAQHRVEVTRAQHAADIALAWRSGDRYRLGAATFEGQQFEPGLLDKLVPWKIGEPYDQARLLRLQQSLVDLDYFNAVSVTPEPGKARDGQVPIKIALAPAKRSIYSAGLRYGTDSGAGVSARAERRWMNRRGHKALIDINLAQNKSDVTAQYRIPAFKWLDGWYAISASARSEQIEDSKTEYVELSATRSGRWHNWNLLAGVTFKRERYDEVANVLFGTYGYSTLVYPSLWAQWKEADDPVYPRHAKGLTVEVRGGSRALGSDVDFLQARVEGRYIRAFGADNRLLLRGELGSIASGDFDLLPPSQRFYAGGDKSVRGFGYKEIGQHFGNVVIERDGRTLINPVVGGKHLAVASVEFEHMFTPTWGMAVFADAGDAYDKKFQAAFAIGAGLRWRSPVGPVRLDIARGDQDDRQTLRLHLVIGPDL